MAVQIKRVYEDVQEEDGFRVLVDRLWPRGVSKKNAKVALWLKDIGPTPALRKWFGHKPEKFQVFKEKYTEELTSGEQRISFQKQNEIVTEHDMVTLVYAAKNTKHNHARVLMELLGKK